MKKGFGHVLLFIELLVILFIFLLLFGFSKISTNKDIYEQGEEVVISYSDFRLMRYSTSPSSTGVIIYQDTPNGWERIIHDDRYVTWGGIACADGRMIAGGHPGDLRRALPFSPYKSGVYTWNSRIYEQKDEKEICGNIKEPVDTFQSKLAPAGKYQIKFGKAKKNFEIKKTEAQTKEIQDETANWKTYKNIKYKFLVEFPIDWYVNENKSTLVSFFPQGETLQDRGIYIKISHKDTPINPVYIEYDTIRKVSIGFEVIEVRKAKNLASEAYMAVIKRGDYHFEFSFGSGLDRKYDAVFDQTISTFRVE